MTLQKLTIFLSALLIACACVGGAFWYTLHHGASSDDWSATSTATTTISMREPSEQDHILGNPNAPLVFVIYSDFQCPFCKEYHTTMQDIMNTYGKEGAVAVVYRHMPIVQLHTQSATYALASECVASLAGNSAFWKFADLLFASSTPEDTADNTKLLSLAKQSGVATSSFTSCMQENKLMERVNTDYKEAVGAGAQATPFTILITPYQKITLTEARPYTVVAASIERVLHSFGYDAKGGKI